MDVDFSGIYLNADNTQDGDIFEIAGEGEKKTIKGIKGDKVLTNIPVNINGVVKIWTPFGKDGQKFVKAFGKDTKNWIGKKGQVSHVKYNSFGQTKVGLEVDPLV